MSDEAFPRDADRCEQCGYPLQGLSRDGECPECGQAIDASDPAHRVGLGWQRRMTPLGWLIAVRSLAFSPNQTYRKLTLGGPLLPARLFLGTVLIFVFAWWWAVYHLAELGGGLLWAGVATGVALAMTYIEAAGVTFVSKREGWSMRWRDAERVACYASVGWAPAAVIMSKVNLIQQHHMNTGVWPRWWPQAWFEPSIFSDIITLALIGCLAIMGFEWLVWFGIKRIRYGNVSPSAAPDTAPSSPAQTTLKPPPNASPSGAPKPPPAIADVPGAPMAAPPFDAPPTKSVGSASRES